MRHARALSVLAAVVLVGACSGDGLSVPSSAPGAPDSTVADTAAAGSDGAAGAPGGDGAAAPDGTDPAEEELPVLDDVVAPPWEPTTRTEELGAEIAAVGDGRVPTQVVIDAFSLAYAPMPGETPADLPAGEGLGSTYTLGLVESVRDRLAPEQRAVLDAIDAGVEEEAVATTTDEVGGAHTSGFAGGSTRVVSAGVVSAGVVSAGVDAAPAPRGPVTTKYLGLLQQAVNDWHAYRPAMVLPPKILLQIMSTEVKGDMDAYPTNPGECRVRVFPGFRAASPSDIDITTAFAHEIFHCAQFLMGNWAGAPSWLIEGSAHFAAFDLYRGKHDPPARYAATPWWTAAGAPLAMREYSAWPLFESYRDYGGDAYAAIARIIANPSMDPAGALAAGGMDGTWFRTEWGSRAVRSTSFADPPWSMPWPGPSGNGGPRDNVAFNGIRGLGAYTVASNGEFSHEQLTVDVTPDVGIVVFVPVHGPVTTHTAAGTLVVAAQEAARLCFAPDGCQCPEGTTSNTIPMDGHRMVYAFAAAEEAPSAVVKAIKWEPKKQCRKKPPARGTHNGDPHLVTFDGIAYDVMALGEMVMARDPEGGFEVQARNEPIGLGGAGTSAVALTDGTHRMTFTAPELDAGVELTVRIDGEVVDPASTGVDGLMLAPGGSEDDWTVTWADGSTADVKWHLGWFVTLSPSGDRAGRLVGLLGAADGDPRNDLRLPDGTVYDLGFDRTRSDQEFARSWLVDDDTTLFDYEPGESPATFAAMELEGLSPLPSDDVVEQCTDALGAEASSYEVDACAYDVTVTGEDSFIDTYVTVVDDRVDAEEGTDTPGGDVPPSDNGTDPTRPSTGDAALTLSGLLAASYAAVVDDAQVASLEGSLELHAGAVVIAVADLCPPEVDLQLVVTRRDTGAGTQTSLCDTLGMRAVFADEDDEVIPGEGYVMIGADGVYDVTISSDSEEALFTTVQVFADDAPEIVDVDDAATDGWSGTLSGVGDAVVLPITTGDDSVTFDVDAPRSVCAIDLYGPDPPGDADPWVIDVCQHGPTIGFSPTGDLVIPIVVFLRGDGTTDVSISREPG